MSRSYDLFDATLSGESVVYLRRDMESEATTSRLGIATVLLASITIGSLVAIGIAASRPRGKAKRLVSRIDRKMNDLESKLHLAAS